MPCRTVAEFLYCARCVQTLVREEEGLESHCYIAVFAAVTSSMAVKPLQFGVYATLSYEWLVSAGDDDHSPDL